uniref:Uncharacterized protein n=1 Tax=Sipha flava TaxID=143950 RepID=A0A2S2QUS4_9HEMI
MRRVRCLAARSRDVYSLSPFGQRAHANNHLPPTQFVMIRLFRFCFYFHVCIIFIILFSFTAILLSILFDTIIVIVALLRGHVPRVVRIYCVRGHPGVWRVGCAG